MSRRRRRPYDTGAVASRLIVGAGRRRGGNDARHRSRQGAGTQSTHTRSGRSDGTRSAAADGYAKGYKLHALIDDGWRVLAWRVRPLNEAECLTAQGLLRDAARSSSPGLVPHTVMLADTPYDSNRLHRRAATLGVQMIAPRRKPHLGLAGNTPSIASAERADHGRRWRWRAHDVDPPHTRRY